MMKFEILQSLEPLTQEAAVNIAKLLNSVKGVGRVVTSGTRINIDFDDDMTSAQELRIVLQQAGYEMKKPVHGENGSCCGSCG